MLGAVESLGCDANDRERTPVDDEAFADDTRRPVETLLPEMMADDDNIVGCGFIVVGSKRPTESRACPKKSKEVCGYAIRKNLLRFTITREVKTTRRERRQIFKGLILRFPIAIVCRSGIALWNACLLTIFPNQNQFIGVMKGQRFK